jgi:signal transduction histidine kinase
VLLNLAGNAVKFTHEGRVSIHVERAGPGHDSGVWIRVEDTGIGISPEHQAGLFERFTQADSSISRRFGGTGLGLAISKKLVEMMGGEIGVDSEVGEGSVFWFRVPLPADVPPENVNPIADLSCEPLPAGAQPR